ncbi:hypothetical protein DCAR_0311610 [Daucus carota subsp. sativus]|uniref:Large ribosomal subunit protein uL10-like insertion domain-containing protein n=1 Tax=Daucus carota subsp. sativus TaxID=79200 RepID=A0AAF0WN15_DAUCS|nr:hypothetical protein DCAR_0311610 [Daucus carota subsp. sativus]
MQVIHTSLWAGQKLQLSWELSTLAQRLKQIMIYPSTTILNIIPLLVENVGLIFTKGDLKEVGAPAHVGLVAPVDVVVLPGKTGLDPSRTSFFQVLNIPTKINKGTIEIITPVELTRMPRRIYWQLPSRQMLADLSKFVVAAAPAATADSGADPAEEKKEEPAKESD